MADVEMGEIFDDIQNYNSLTFTVDIEIVDEYDEFGESLRTNDEDDSVQSEWIKYMQQEKLQLNINKNDNNNALKLEYEKRFDLLSKKMEENNKLIQQMQKQMNQIIEGKESYMNTLVNSLSIID